jgi:Uma2 family endonuclease
MSPRDTLARIRRRAQDYFAMGVPVCWIIDPIARQAWTATPTSLTEATDGILRAGDIEMPLGEVLE